MSFLHYRTEIAALLGYLKHSGYALEVLKGGAKQPGKTPHGAWQVQVYIFRESDELTQQSIAVFRANDVAEIRSAFQNALNAKLSGTEFRIKLHHESTEVLAPAGAELAEVQDESEGFSWWKLLCFWK